MLLLAQGFAAWLFFLGIAMLVAILLRRFYRYQAKQKKNQKENDAPIVSSQSSPDKPRQPLIDAPPEIIRWQVEMHELAREMKAELDTKMVALQKLIQLANQAEQRLTKAVEASQTSQVDQSRINTSTLETLSEIASILGTQTSEESLNRLTELTNISDASLGISGGSHEQVKQVFYFADQGWSAIKISEKLQLPVGDVELILSLRVPQIPKD